MLAPLNRRRCTLMIIIANDRLEGSATVVLVATDIRQLRLDDDDDDRLFFLFFGSFLFPQPHLPILLNLPPLRKEKKGEKLLNRKWLRPRRPSTEINKNKQTARCAACEIRLPRLQDFLLFFWGAGGGSGGGEACLDILCLHSSFSSSRRHGTCCCDGPSHPLTTTTSFSLPTEEQLRLVSHVDDDECLRKARQSLWTIAHFIYLFIFKYILPFFSFFRQCLIIRQLLLLLLLLAALHPFFAYDNDLKILFIFLLWRGGGDLRCNHKKKTKEKRVWSCRKPPPY